MPGVFISYRREDSSGYAGRLFDILSARFGRENTYMDLDMIKGGDNFEIVIEEKVSQCDVLLAVIGEKWLTITGVQGSRRLDMADDFVRLEIAKALQRGVRVIPILVGGATMPHEDDLPSDLHPLSVRQAMDLRDAHFHPDANLLMDELSKTVPSITSRSRKLKSNRLAIVLLSVLAVAVIACGILVFRPTKATRDPNPNSAAPKSSAPADEVIPPVQAVNPTAADKPKSPETARVNAAKDLYRKYRTEVLRKPEYPLVVVVTATGGLDLSSAVFHTPRTRVLILTTEQGKQRLSQSGSEALASVEVKVLPAPENRISPSAILTLLRQEAGVELLLHEAGPTLFGQFLAGGFMDELFLTVAPQIAGRVAEHPRPGLVSNVQFSPATAPRWKLLSTKSAADFLFLRYQVREPRIAPALNAGQHLD